MKKTDFLYNLFQVQCLSKTHVLRKSLLMKVVWVLLLLSHFYSLHNFYIELYLLVAYFPYIRETISIELNCCFLLLPARFFEGFSRFFNS